MNLLALDNHFCDEKSSIGNEKINPNQSHQSTTILPENNSNIPVADNVIDFAVTYVRLTRKNKMNKSLNKWLNWGAGPRASAMLISAAKANALLNNRTTPNINDVEEMIKPILRHRIIPNFTAEAEGVSRDEILQEILDSM